MYKKIILGALLIGVIGVLIVGAVNRTSATSGERAGETGRRGRATEVVTADANQQNYGGRGNETSLGTTGQGNGRGAQSGQAVAGDGQGAPLADVAAEDWLTMTGKVVSVADDLVEIKTDAGEVIPFEGRPLSFAAEQGFSLEVGHAVTVSGYDENGEFKIGKITNLNSGLSLALRDTSGRPGWAGRGRQG
jgi:hypothetical protein